MDQTEIANIIVQVINSIFNDFFSSIDNRIYSNLDNIVFINSDIISNSIITKLLNSSNINSLIYLADAMLIAVSIFYCIRYYFSNIVETSVERPIQFIFKLFIFAFLINFSYFLVEQLFNLNYLISSSIQDIGATAVGHNINFSDLILKLNSKVFTVTDNFNLFSIDGIIKSLTSVGFINLLLIYSLRYILLQVLILFSPFAMLSLINASTSWLFKSWFRSLFSLLILQIFIPLVILVIFIIDDSNEFLFVAGIYSLIKINDYIREIFGGIGINVSYNFNSMMGLLKK